MSLGSATLTTLKHPLGQGLVFVASILSLDSLNKFLATIVGLLTIAYWIIKIRKETREK